MLSNFEPTWVPVLLANSEEASPTVRRPLNDHELLDAYSETVSGAASEVAPAVVNIQVKNPSLGRRGEGGGSSHRLGSASLPGVRRLEEVAGGADCDRDWQSVRIPTDSDRRCGQRTGQVNEGAIGSIDGRYYSNGRCIESGQLGWPVGKLLRTGHRCEYGGDPARTGALLRDRSQHGAIGRSLAHSRW